jgi:hypothetical protein
MDDRTRVIVPIDVKKPVFVPVRERRLLQGNPETESKDHQFDHPTILCESGTFDEDDDDYDAPGHEEQFIEGIQWEPQLTVPVATTGLLKHGILVNELIKGSFVGVDPSEPLFPGSPYSARDFCRYLLAMKHHSSKYYLFITICPHI